MVFVVLTVTGGEMSKEIFICGDHHFSHKNIMKYDERPFSSVAEMNETMIERHNEVVKPNDEVYTVGDFCFGVPTTGSR